MALNKIIASFFGIGYLGKGAGTVAAAVLCVMLFLSMKFNIHSNKLLLFFISATLLTGLYSTSQVEKSWGKDNRRVVIDEILGMAVSMVFLPINFITLLAGLILFRFFDIRKPLGIRKLEDLKGGWGVMMDDVLAGVYSNVLLQLLVNFSPYSHEDIF